MTQRQLASSRSLQQTINAIPRWAVYFCGALPGLWLFYLATENRLGADPVKALEHELGLWALRFLIASLAVSPLRRIGGPSLLRYRRALGLLTFFYALTHVAVYVVLDQGSDLNAIVADIIKRPYITAGMVAFTILVPLAVTSNNAMMRTMQTAWARLHKWVYVAVIAAVLHFILAVKSWPAEPVIYAVLVIALLGLRIVFAMNKGSRRSSR